MRHATGILGFISLLLVSLLPLTAGELKTLEVESAAIGETVKVNVLLPDGYGEKKDARYPSVYLLHGYGGDYTEWARVGIEEEAKGLDVIIVMPEGDQSFWVNWHEKPEARWEDYVVSEVVPLIDREFRTKPHAASRGISGLSMGGYGALALGLRHPELFSSIASHSGALDVPRPVSRPRIDERLREIFGPDDSPARTKYDLLALMDKLDAAARPALYIDCGSQDFLLPANRKLVAALAERRVPYEYREVPGGHDFAYWKRNVRVSLTRHLAAFEKAARARAIAAAAAKASRELAGDWALVWTMEFNGQQIERDYTLRIQKKDGASGLGAAFISPRSGNTYQCKSVSFSDGSLRLVIDRDFGGNVMTLIYQGKLDKGAFSGAVQVEGTDEFQSSWRASRAKGE